MSDKFTLALGRKILRRDEVKRRTGWSTSTLYAKMADGIFPKPIKLDPEGRAVGWIEDEVDAYQASRIASRDAAA